MTVVVQPDKQVVVGTSTQVRGTPVPHVVVKDGPRILVVGDRIIVRHPGLQGPAGDRGPAGVGIPELYDSNIPPVMPTFPYLRFERDGDGDVQAIYLGTAT